MCCRTMNIASLEKASPLCQMPCFPGTWAQTFATFARGQAATPFRTLVNSSDVSKRLGRQKCKSLWNLMKHILLAHVKAMPQCKTHHFNFVIIYKRLWAPSKNRREADTTLLKNNLWEKGGIKDVTPLFSDRTRKTKKLTNFFEEHSLRIGP